MPRRSEARRLGLVMVALAVGGCGQPEEECPGCDDIGTPITAESQIEAWDIAIPPSGQGLPPGQGSAHQGREIFEFGPTELAHFVTIRDQACPSGPSKCATCHGIEGVGGLNAPPLVGGRDPTLPPPHPLATFRPVKTVGSYWPYATTLFDYIRRAMPFDCPGSLDADQVYAVTAYLLFLNGVIAADEVMDARTLPAINQRMPNHDNFYQTPPPHLPKGPGPGPPRRR